MFVAASFENREETQKLCFVLEKTNFEIYCFARDEGIFTTSKEMMEKSAKEIEKSDIFLMDASEKHTGRSIEAGIAYAYGKKIIVIAKNGTMIKDTITGIADMVIKYERIEEILALLSELNK